MPFPHAAEKLKRVYRTKGGQGRKAEDLSKYKLKV
jgi:hypothetical protein